MIRFLLGIAVGAIATAGAYLWLVFRPIRIEIAPPYPARDPWGDQ